MGWAGHVAHMGESSGACRVLVGKPEGKETTWKTLGIDRRITARWVFRKWVVGSWTGLMWLRIGAYLCVNEPSVSMICWELLD